MIPPPKCINFTGFGHSFHVSDSVPSDLSPISPLLFPMTKAAEAALQQHRLQGHVPFDPRCVACQRGKAVFQHRRRKEGQFEAEVQADFGYITIFFAGGCLG